MKKNLVILMGVLLVLAWYTTISTWFGNEGKYQAYLEEAKRLEEKGLYLDAITTYEEARELKINSLEVEEYIADAYLAMGNHKEYKKQLNRIIEAYGPVEADVEKLVDYYRNYSTENSLIDCLVDLYDQYPDSPIIKKHYDSIKGAYEEKFISVDYIDTYRGKYASFRLGDKIGLLDEEGDIVVEAVYDELNYNGEDEDSITVRDGKEYFLINTSGYKTKQPDEEYEYMGLLAQGRIVAKKNGKFGYLNASLEKKVDFLYDDATAFHEGIAAVKKKDRWALINRQGEELTEFIYEHIAINSMNICSMNELIGVCQDGSWFFIDKEGERIGEGNYEQIKAFEGEEPCAVKRNGKWGFADTEGNLIIECSYQDAKSFANGFAPVKTDKLWGYIDLENNLVIQGTFDDAFQMTAKGIAPVSHGGSWTLIELKIMN